MSAPTPAEIRKAVRYREGLFAAGVIPAKNAAPKARPEIPPLVRKALDNYVFNHWPVGGFVTACLENNFVQAVALADERSFEALKVIARHCYNELPSECWGSPEKVRAWLA